MANLQPTATSYPSVVITTAAGGTMNSNQQVYEEDTNLPLAPYRRKNMGRATTLTPVNFMLISSGMHIFWGIYTNPIVLPVDVVYSYFHLVYSWYIGAVIGSIIAAVLVRKYRRTYLMYASGALLLLSGILFAALPLQYEALAVARYIAGVAHGLLFLTAVIHAGEIAPKRLRGEYLSSVNMCLLASYLASTFIYRIQLDRASNLPVNQIYGICHVVCSVLGLLLVPLYFKESPIFLIGTGNNNEAFSTLVALQRPAMETPGLRYEFDDLRNLVAEEENQSGLITSDGNWMACIQAGLLRGLFALALSMPLNIAAYVPFALLLKISLVIIIPLFARFIGELLAFFTLDRVGRRCVLLISTGGSGVFLLIWSILLVATDSSKLLEALSAIVFLYQFFLGLGLSPISATFISEAFPLSKKAFSVLFAVVIEYLIHLFVIIALMVLYGRFTIIPLAFVTAVLMLLATGFFYKFFPETKGLTLRESRDEVKQSSSL